MIEQTQQTNDLPGRPRSACAADRWRQRRDRPGAGELGHHGMNQGAANAGGLVVGIQYQVVNQDGKWKISRVDAW